LASAPSLAACSPAAGFRPAEFYRPSGDGYCLLPFRFLRFDTDRYVLVNEVGEYLFVTPAVLQDLVHHRIQPTNSTYRDLKRKHFLLDSASETPLELLAAKYRTKKSFLRGFTGLHIFVVTLRCDHSCPYCQVSRVSVDRDRYDMSPETVARAIDLMFRSPSRDLKVEFQGGEPLLNFDLIRRIVEAVEARNAVEQRDIQFVVATNLAPLTDEMLEFFREHRVAISTSLDGPEFLHNANRPRPGNDSYVRTISGIRRTRAALGSDAIAALMTTTRLSLRHPREIVDEYVTQGFHSIFLRPLTPLGFAAKTKRSLGYSMAEFVEFYRIALEYLLDLNQRGVFIAETYAQIILTKILTPFATRYVDLQSPGGLGIGVAVYNYDGDVYASDESRMLAEMGDHSFRLGNVHKHSYEEIFGGPLLASIVENSCVESLPGCSDCPYQPYCGADPVLHYATQGDLVGHRPTSEFCTKNMTIINLLLRLLEDHSVTSQIFWSWIHGRPSCDVPNRDSTTVPSR
jgi:His-Xaa-Ser system radical SAM maturase HxsB